MDKGYNGKVGSGLTKMVSTWLHNVRVTSSQHPWLVLGLTLVTVVLSSGDLLEVIPRFAPVAASPYFPYIRNANEMLAVGVIVYAAFTGLTAVATGLVFLYLIVHVPYVFLDQVSNGSQLLRFAVMGVVGLVGVRLVRQLQDVAKRLEASETKAAGVIETAVDAIIVTDERGTITSFNAAAQKMFGYQVPEVVGQNVRILMPEPDRSTHDGHISDYLHTGVPKMIGIGRELVGQRKDGTTFPIELSLGEVRLDNGSLFTAIVRDLTERKQMEDALVASETRYRRLFEAAKDGILIVDARTGLIVDANPFLTDLLGFSKEEFVGKELWEIGVFKDIVANKDRFEELRQKGRVRYDNLPLRTADGRQADVEFVSNVYEVDHTTVIQCNIRDITERKQMEDRLRETESNFRRSFDDSPLGIRIVRSGGEETLYANRALLEIFDCDSLEELNRVSIVKRYTPESYAEREVRYQMRQRGEYVSPHYEISIVRKDGELRRLEAFRKEVLWNGERLIQVLYGDITERKKLEEALRGSAERYRSVVENIQDLVYRVRGDPLKGRVDFVSPRVSDVLGYRAEDFYKDPELWFRSLHPEDVSRVIEETQRIVAGSSDSQRTYRIRRKGSKEYRYMEDKVSLAFDSAGNIIGIDGVARDVTERQKLEEALRESQQLYQAVVDSARDAISITVAGSRVLANKAFLEIFGLQEMSQATAPPVGSFIVPDDRERVVAWLLAHQHGEPVPGLLRFGIRHPDGQERTLEASGSFVTYKGQPAVLTLSRDVTVQSQMAEALQESERLYRAVVDNANDAIAISVGGMRVFANRAFLTLHGLTNRDQAVGLPVDHFVVPRDKALVRAGVTARQRGERGAEVFEYHIRRADGAERTVEASASPVTYRGQAASMAVIRDVTERENLESALRESEQLYRAIADNANDAISINVGEKRVFVNKTFLPLYGLQHISQAMEAPVAHFVVPEDRALVRERELARQRGEHVPAIYAIRIRRADGEERTMEISISLITYKGQPASLAIIRDVTERKKLEEAFRESEQLYRDVVDNANDAISISVDGIRVFVNEAFLKLHGLQNVSQAVGMPVEQFVGQEDKDLVRQRTMSRQLGARSSAVYEYRIHRVDGEERTVEVSSSTVVYKGQPAVLTILRDISERKRAQEQILRADKLASVGTLVAGVVHEVNNPLTAAVGRVELVLMKDMEEGTRSDLQIVRSETWRAVNILRSLLAFARERKLTKEMVSLNDVLEATLELRVYEMRVNNLVVVKDLQQDLPRIMADPHQMQQVFLNIVINAEHAMSDAHGRGTLTMKTRQVRDAVWISFADDGPGIPPENLGKVFDPFFTTKPEGKGTGLGLSVCYGIVQAHGGSIRVGSGMSQGATFIVELPIITESSDTD